MTSKISFFNIGIYKNILHRFRLGSLMYFIMLFMSLPFWLLVVDKASIIPNIENDLNYGRHLLESSYITFPVLFSFVVPTVVSLLVSGYVRSSKQGVFTHALPVTRCEIYFSSLLAAFTLMFIPVFLNGVILMIMSFCGYGTFMSPLSVVYWIIINCGLLFIMFSVASVASFLTGNGVAHAAINALFHVFPVMLALAIYSICNAFLYGFSNSDAFISTVLVSETPIVRIFSDFSAGKFIRYAAILNPRTWIYLLGAVILYALGFILYKKRKIEACGDVAAFKVFKPILKYTLTAISAVIMFAILTSLNINLTVTFIMMALISAIVYFVCEMLINKTLNVLNRYKGFIGFSVFAAVIIASLALTSIFGYETRIPNESNVASATAYNGEEVSPVNDREFINNLIQIHSEMIQDIPLMNTPFEQSPRYLNISYVMKDDSIINRRYSLSDDEYDSVMSKLYRSTEYKLNVCKFNNINIENVDYTDIAFNDSTVNSSHADSPELLEAIKKDVEALPYEKFDTDMSFNISFSVTKGENKSKNIFKTIPDYFAYYDDYIPLNFYISVNHNFANTLEFLKKNGYYGNITEEMSKNMYMCKLPFTKSGDKYTYKGQTGDIKEFKINLNDCIKLPKDKALNLFDTTFNYDSRDMSDGDNYLIFMFNRYNINNNLDTVLFATDKATQVNAEIAANISEGISEGE